jgi:hypothetical protein
MSTRRDFLAFTAGAIAWQSVLIVEGYRSPRRGARAELHRMAETDPVTAEMLAWWDDATPSVRHCFVTALVRLHGGMPVEEAGRRFKLEVAGQTDPDNWRRVRT